MKRTLTIILILVMVLALLTGCRKSQGTEGPPWPAIGVRSMAQLNEMREMVSCADEEKLNEYLRSVEGGGARSREDLVAFLNLIDYLPVLELLKGDITWINHGKDIAGNESVVISTQGETGDWTRVEYLAWGKGVNDEIEFKKDNGYFENSVIDTPIYFCDGRIAVYSEIRDPHPSGNGYTVTWTIVVNGILANVVYCSEEIDDISAESVFDDVTIGTLKPTVNTDSNEFITVSFGDSLSAILLSDSDKRIFLDILGSDAEWINDAPNCIRICHFSGVSLSIQYGDCGVIYDVINKRFRELTFDERQSMNSLISRYNPTEFSYANAVATYTEGSPGVKHTGFKNTTEYPVSCGTQALERAKTECTIKYNDTRVYYDAESNVWMVLFYKRNTLGGCQSVYMDSDGKTLMIVYGE